MARRGTGSPLHLPRGIGSLAQPKPTTPPTPPSRRMGAGWQRRTATTGCHKSGVDARRGAHATATGERSRATGAVFRPDPTGARIAIEASGIWWWFVDLVERLGHHAVLSNPKQTKAIAAARLKNDRVDAEQIGEIQRFPSAPRQLRGPDSPRPSQRQSCAEGPHQQRGQSHPPLGSRRRHASRAPAWSIASVVPGRPATEGLKIARVAFARRLAEIVYQLWKQEIDFVTLVRGRVRG
jgi:hypothetical protein